MALKVAAAVLVFRLEVAKSKGQIRLVSMEGIWGGVTARERGGTGVRGGGRGQPGRQPQRRGGVAAGTTVAPQKTRPTGSGRLRHTIEVPALH